MILVPCTGESDFEQVWILRIPTHRNCFAKVDAGVGLPIKQAVEDCALGLAKREIHHIRVLPRQKGGVMGVVAAVRARDFAHPHPIDGRSGSIE